MLEKTPRNTHHSDQYETIKALLFIYIVYRKKIAPGEKIDDINSKLKLDEVAKDFMEFKKADTTERVEIVCTSTGKYVSHGLWFALEQFCQKKLQKDWLNNRNVLSMCASVTSELSALGFSKRKPFESVINIGSKGASFLVEKFLEKWKPNRAMAFVATENLLGEVFSLKSLGYDATFLASLSFVDFCASWTKSWWCGEDFDFKKEALQRVSETTITFLGSTLGGFIGTCCFGYPGYVLGSLLGSTVAPVVATGITKYVVKPVARATKRAWTWVKSWFS